MKYRKQYSSIPPCHSGPVEVINNLFCGSADEALIMVDAPIKVDTLFPLHDLNPKIWDLGFRGEVMYCPIHDFGILPDDVLNSLVSKILDRLSRNKKVGLFCMGGHGRTGYVAAIVLGKLGYKDPIQFLRSKYCPNAVESNTQVEHIAKVLNIPTLAEKYRAYNDITGDIDLMFAGRYDYWSNYVSDFSASRKKRKCRECAYFSALGCLMNEDYTVRGNDTACMSFEE